MGTTKGVRVFYSVKLLTLILIFYFPSVLAGDEPAPVVYIDPVTGELRVQNPPKLSRDHGASSQSVDNMTQATEQSQPSGQNQPAEQNISNNNESLLFSGLITFSVIVVAILFYWQRKKTTA